MRKYLLILILPLAAQFTSGSAPQADLSDAFSLNINENLWENGDPASAAVSFSISVPDSVPLAGGEPAYPAAAAAMAWQVQILDSRGVKVAYVQGTGLGEGRSLLWSGLASDGGALPDGFYKARLVWTDGTGRLYRTGDSTLSLSMPMDLKRLAELGVRFEYTREGMVARFLDSLTFPAGGEKISPSARASLDAMADFLKKHPANRVIVRGHADSRGSAARNAALSLRRASAVRDYFISRDIDVSRFGVEGAGSSAPVASNRTVSGRSRNRRVDVVVLKLSV